MIKGDLPIQISWLFNNKNLENNTLGIEISRLNKRISTLSIDSVGAVHAGEYTCLANNSAAAVSHSAQLRINGKRLGDTYLETKPCIIPLRFISL